MTMRGDCSWSHVALIAGEPLSVIIKSHSKSGVAGVPGANGQGIVFALPVKVCRVEPSLSPPETPAVALDVALGQHAVTQTKWHS